MSERVAPELMVKEEWVTLYGYERAFHKQSWVRGCHPDDAVLNPEGVPERFKTPVRNLSLVLGLKPNPEAFVLGYLQTYPADVAADVLKQLDRREGFDPSRPSEELAYLRGPCRVVDEEGTSREALTYFTNPASEKVDDSLSIESQAAILAAATSAEGNGSKARGLFYLEGVRAALRTAGHHDQILEALSGCAYKWYVGRLHLLSPEG